MTLLFFCLSPQFVNCLFFYLPDFVFVLFFFSLHCCNQWLIKQLIHNKNFFLFVFANQKLSFHWCLIIWSFLLFPIGLLFFLSFSLSICPSDRPLLSICPSNRPPLSICPSGCPLLSICPSGRPPLSICPSCCLPLSSF